jgi:hypothetical protein
MPVLAASKGKHVGSKSMESPAPLSLSRKRAVSDSGRTAKKVRSKKKDLLTGAITVANMGEWE